MRSCLLQHSLPVMRHKSFFLAELVNRMLKSCPDNILCDNAGLKMV